QESQSQPVINQGPETGSVTDGGIFFASGQFTASVPNPSDTLVWSVDGGSSVASESYQYGVDEFTVLKTISGTSTKIFDDTFNGTVPPSGPNFLIGSTPPNGAYADSGGTYVAHPHDALMEGSNAAPLGYSLSPSTYDQLVFGQYTSLLTGTSYNAPQGIGLRSGQSFSVSGAFDFTIPPDTTTRYGIRLTDR